MVRGFSRFALFLFLGLLRAPTRNSPERVRDTIWTFPEKSGKHPGLETPRFSFSQKNQERVSKFGLILGRDRGLVNNCSAAAGRAPNWTGRPLNSSYQKFASNPISHADLPHSSILHGWKRICSLFMVEIIAENQSTTLFGDHPFSIKHPQDNFSLQNVNWHPPKCKLATSNLQFLYRNTQKSPLANLCVGGRQFAFWRLKLSWGCFIEKRGPPKRVVL